jgi:hypothetical protein
MATYASRALVLLAQLDSHGVQQPLFQRSSRSFGQYAGRTSMTRHCLAADACTAGRMAIPSTARCPAQIMATYASRTLVLLAQLDSHGVQQPMFERPPRSFGQYARRMSMTRHCLAADARVASRTAIPSTARCPAQIMATYASRVLVLLAQLDFSPSGRRKGSLSLYIDIFFNF